MKDSLANEFEINLGDLRYFLGVEVAKSKNKILLSHTRPNITFAVGIVNQYMHAPYECSGETFEISQRSTEELLFSKTSEPRGGGVYGC